MTRKNPPPILSTAAQVADLLRTHACDRRANVSRSFFKTGTGEYAENDRFLGVPVPRQRMIARQARGIPKAQIECLLTSPWHEERFTGLVLLVDAFESGESQVRHEVVSLYLRRLSCVNNWDLVDISAWQILGRHVRAGAPSPLPSLARSSILWERRIAMVSTYAWIRESQAEPALSLAGTLLSDPEDLIHKAVGWMLREVGKHAGKAVLEAFLEAHSDNMPRTALRYAIERFPDPERRQWLSRGKKNRVQESTNSTPTKGRL